MRFLVVYFSMFFAFSSVEWLNDFDEAKEIVSGYIEQIKTSAPLATSICKTLVNSAVEETAEKNRERIAKVFKEMMNDSEEARHGTRELMAGRKDIDWARWYRAKERKTKL